MVDEAETCCTGPLGTVDADDHDEARRAILYDPRTSGGQLLLVPADEPPALLAEVAGARAIGRVQPVGPKPLIARG